MDKSTSGNLAYEFGAFRLEPRHRVLSHADGRRVEIAAKAFDALLYLVERAGTVVTRDELMKALWPRTIVEDNSLNKLVAALRRALGADEYIATLQGRGYQFVADVRRSDERPAPTPEVPQVVKASESPARARWRWVAATALVVAIAATAAWHLRPLPSSPSGARSNVMRFRIDLAQGLRLWGGAPLDFERLFGLQRPSRPSFALSPDGRYLVYAATDGTTARLYKRRMDEQESNPIPGSEGGAQPVFSADSSVVAFFVGNELKRVPTNGGEVRTVAISGATPHADSGVSWTENETLLVFAEATGKDPGVYEVPANGGEAVQLTRLDRSAGDFWHRYPQMLPSRRALLLNVINLEDLNTPSEWRIEVLPLDGSQRRVVVGRGSRPVYLPSGQIVFARNGQLWAVPFDTKRLEATGAPVVVLEDVMDADRAPNSLLNSGAAQFSISRDGSLAYAPGRVYPPAADTLVWLDASPNGAVESLPLPPGSYSHPRFSPDGTKLAYATGTLANLRLWVYDIALALPEPLTPTSGYLAPVWSPDGKRITFSTSSATGGLFWTAADRSGSVQRIAGMDGVYRAQASSWSIDDRLALVGVPSVSNSPNGIWTIRMDDTSQRERLPTDSEAFAPSFSPDGKWIAYTSLETNRPEIYVQPFPGGAVSRVSDDGGNEPVWSPDGRQLFYTFREAPDKPLRIMAVDFPAGPTSRKTRPRLLIEGQYLNCAPVRCYDISPDGKRFIAVRRAPPDPQPVTGINIVVNWSQTLNEPAAAH